MLLSERRFGFCFKTLCGLAGAVVFLPRETLLVDDRQMASAGRRREEFA